VALITALAVVGLLLFGFLFAGGGAFGLVIAAAVIGVFALITHRNRRRRIAP
jgi:multisubunit Na+/H+ antiporter MnhB subunit